MTDVRVFDGADGRYVHARDLQALFERTAQDVEDWQSGTLLRAVAVVEMIGELPFVGRPAVVVDDPVSRMRPDE